MEALKPSELALALGYTFAAKRSPMVHGDPGLGKSQIMRQVSDVMFAEKYGCKVKGGKLYQCRVVKGKKSDLIEWDLLSPEFERPWFRDFRVAMRDAVDLMGVPYVENGMTQMAKPMVFNLDERGGVIFMDEINRGTEMVMNACFQLLDSGTVGEHRLPSSWLKASAVNDKDAGARKMSSALLARFSHLDLKTDVDDVSKHAVSNEWEPPVIAFIRFHPALLHAYNPKERVSPNPRAWDYVSQTIAQGVPDKLLLPMIAGLIGEGAAIDFMSFLKLYRELPSIDAIMMDPVNAVIPEKPGALYAVASALARRVTEQSLGRVMQYLDRLPTEYNVLCIRDAFRRLPVLQSTPQATSWCTKHAEVMFG